MRAHQPAAPRLAHCLRHAARALTAQQVEGVPQQPLGQEPGRQRLHRLGLVIPGHGRAGARDGVWAGSWCAACKHVELPHRHAAVGPLNNSAPPTEEPPCTGVPAHERTCTAAASAPPASNRWRPCRSRSQADRGHCAAGNQGHGNGQVVGGIAWCAGWAGLVRCRPTALPSKGLTCKCSRQTCAQSRRQLRARTVAAWQRSPGWPAALACSKTEWQRAAVGPAAAAAAGSGGRRVTNAADVVESNTTAAC